MLVLLNSDGCRCYSFLLVDAVVPLLFQVYRFGDVSNKRFVLLTFRNIT